MELKNTRNNGFTLVETLAAMVILAIAAVGTLSYQYHSTRHSRTARLEMTATRTAQLLLEDWKSKGGEEDYDPRNLGMGFVEDPQGEFYKAEIDGLPIFVKFVFSDIDSDESASITLRQITVIVRWRRDFSDIEPELQDPHLVLTTYTRLDGSGG